MYIITDLLIWWYSKGFILLLKYLKSFIQIVFDSFSVRIIISTFFKPWKKDVTSTKGLSIDQKFRVWGFNLISIGFGMVIKFFTFAAFLISFSVLILIELAMIIIWICLPMIFIEILVIGILFLTK